MLKKIGNILSTMVLIAMILLAILLAGPYAAGIKTYAVVSGSMEPALHTGSLAYVKPADASEIKEGDIITFFMSGSSMVATHRVVNTDDKKREFTTKGDANNTKDAPISFDSLVGKTLISIPYLGYLTMFIKTKQGMVLAVCILTLMILFSAISKIIGKEKYAATKI